MTEKWLKHKFIKSVLGKLDVSDLDIKTGGHMQ